MQKKGELKDKKIPDWVDLELLAKDLIDLEVAFRNKHKDGWLTGKTDTEDQKSFEGKVK